MKSFLGPLWLSVVLIWITSIEADEFNLNGYRFVLPDGFDLEQVAGPPLVERPISADFDEQGRLYVTDSSGSNENVKKQLEEKPHRIVRLEDLDGDGRFDRSVVFADQMMFPEGALWHDGSLYVAAPPSIWKLTDTDDDGIADQREEWFQGKTLTGCANDLHGPYLGHDGWIYWCKGAFAQQSYERPGREPFETRSAHIFRCRPNGSGIEPVMTGGMDNPVEVVFTPGGERIFTTTFLQHPAGGLRDGLIHAIYGGVYGKVHDVIDDHPRTGEVMPVLTHLGAAAPCGLVLTESDQFGGSFAGNIFAALFNMRKITRHVLVPAGATFKTRDEDFLVCDDFDFHPTDVLEDADGSLLVVDTGGWYKLCCPTSQLEKPEVLGSIYRIRRTGSHNVTDPRGLKIAWKNLTAKGLSELLGDSRPFVRQRALHQLASIGPSAVREIKRVLGDSPRTAVRRTAVWALTRIPGPQARQAVQSALNDSDELVRQAAIHSISVWRDRTSQEKLVELLPSMALHNQRAAAEALGRMGNPKAVPALLNAAGEATDRPLEHSIIFALIEIGDPQQTRAGLGSANPRVRKAALIALDQMRHGSLEPAEITPFLAAQEPDLRLAVMWVLENHPNWGAELAKPLRQLVTEHEDSNGIVKDFSGVFTLWIHDRDIQQLLADLLKGESVSRETKVSVLAAMSRSNLEELPSPWLDTVISFLSSDDHELLLATIHVLRRVPVPDSHAFAVRKHLIQMGANESLPILARLNSLAAIPGGLDEGDVDLMDFLVLQLHSDRPVIVRSLAADILARGSFALNQLRRIIPVLPEVGPLELERVLTPFANCSDEDVGHQVVAAMRDSPVAAGLPGDVLAMRLASFSPSVLTELESLQYATSGDRAQQLAELETLLASLPDGDVRRGQEIFNSTRSACRSCHTMGYLGGKIGPDLTRIGRTRTKRDILESIVFPSLSFVRSYEPVMVVSTAGEVFNATVKSEGETSVVLTVGADQEVSIPRDEIDEMRPSNVSLMPAALDKQLTQQELADLVAFLEAAR